MRFGPHCMRRDWIRAAWEGILEPHDAHPPRRKPNHRPIRISRESVAMTAGRWGAGFSAVSRFVGEIEAAAAGNGPLRPGYVLGRRRSFSSGPLPFRGAKRICSARSERFLSFRHGSEWHFDFRDARSRTDAVADGAVSGDLYSQRAAALHARREEGRICSTRSLFSFAESAGAAYFRCRLLAHSFRHPPHGDGRQESL